jgi:hypothetical protein
VAFPVIPVCVVDCSSGAPAGPRVLTCAAVPRVGDVLYPERGTPVVVRLVVWEAATVPGASACLRPLLFASEPTTEERVAITTYIPG